MNPIIYPTPTMRPTLASILLATVLLTGCTQTRNIGSDADADYTFDQLHQSLEGRQVDIHLQDERTIASTALVIRPDSIWAIDALTGDVRGASTREVAAIRHNRPGRGAVHGAVLGAAIGSMVGLATGFALTSVRDKDEATTTVAYYVSVPSMVFAVAGLGTGTILGLRRGSYDRYVYPTLRMADEPVQDATLPARADARRRN